jgi:hypothetical protein
MLTVRDEQMNDMQAASGKPPVQKCLKEKTWIEIHLTDDEGDPAAGVKYRVKLPDGTLKEGDLDGDGKARFEGIDPGSAEVTFPEVHAKEWGAA